MMSVKNIYLFVLVLCFGITSCANTSITEDWLIDDQSKTFKHPIIIAISDSQQTRQIYEKNFVSQLKKRNITATPSYKLISSKQEINRETVVNAIKGSNIDAVLVTYLISVDSEIRQQNSPIDMGYSGNVEDIMLSDTLIASRGRSSSTEIVNLKTDFYDVALKKLIWSVRTKSVAPESIDEVIVDVTDLLIDQLYSDDLFE